MPAPLPSKTKAKVFNSWLPVLACMLFIFSVSSLPADKIPDLFPFQEVVYHFLIYAILALFFSRALKKTCKDKGSTKIILSSVIFGVVYGISDEWHQSFVPYRSVTGFDVFIDGFGSFVGSLIYQWPR